MRTRAETRLECLRLACSLGTSKNIPPAQVVPYAMEFLAWVDGDDAVSDKKLDDLKERFRK